ncbi:glycerophosphoryl diester phosphodiesterase membrane domain-containing protein [Streptococcus equinus]|uniref:glycerophosphoryl diester phosphodiesterase membrane domain-containing protein n=1 Tax=Streptococcus equinus TaxID=1335 RepID=UPI003B5CA532
MRKVLKDFRKNKESYLLRAGLFQLVFTTIGAYMLPLVFKMLVIHSRVPAINIDYVNSFLTNPLLLVALLVHLFLLAFLTYLELSVLVEVICHKELKWQFLKSSLKEKSKNFLKTISGKHCLAFLSYLALLVPFLRFLVAASFLENLDIPSFMMWASQASDFVKLSVGAFYLIFSYLNLRFIYTIPLAVKNESKHFGWCMKESLNLTRGKKIFRTFGIVFIGLVILFCVGLLSGVTIGFASLIGGSTRSFWGTAVFLTIIWLIFFAARLLFKLFSLSYLLKTIEKDDCVINSQNGHSMLALAGLCLLVFGLGFAYNTLKATGKQAHDVTVVGHRGMSPKGVENSIESLEAAARAGADYSELDIVLSKDGQFVVSHDDNLKRLTGKDVTISTSKAKEVVGLKTKQGSHYSQIASFDDCVAKAKQLGIKLLVELKTTGNEPDNYAQLFVDKMKSLKIDKSYLVMSSDLQAAEKVKETAPEMTVGHTISFQVGDCLSPKMDFYAIEDFSYNEYLAHKVHQNGKKIFVWTVNSKDDIERYLKTSADGIITDYTSSVRKGQKDLTSDVSYLDYFLQIMNLSWIENL